MAAVCIWYKEEQKGNKTGMNQDRVYENRRNSYQGNPMERPEPFFAAQPLWGRSMEEQQEARERQRMQSYYSRTASDLQRLVEAECDRMDYRGSMMYDEFPDRLMMEAHLPEYRTSVRQGKRREGRENGRRGTARFDRRSFL